MNDLRNAHIGNLPLLGETKAKFSYDADSSINLVKPADKKDDLKAVANQFEAIFLEMLLKQARESKLSDGLFDTNSDDNFVQMFDAELAKSASELVDIGIAEAIVQQMSPRGSRS